MLFCFVGLAEYLPFIWLLSMPVYGSFYGTDIVIRYFMQLALILILCSLIPQYLSFMRTAIQTTLFTVILSTHIFTLPYIVLWTIDTLLYISEPLWLAIEACGAVFIVMRISVYLSENIEDNPTVCKGLILGLCGLSYGALLLVLKSWSNENFLWYLVLVLPVAVTVHVIMFLSEDGIVSDAAFITFSTAFLLLVKQHEDYYTSHPLEVPESWNGFPNVTLLTIFKEASSVSLGNSTKAMMFLRKLMSPVYVVMVTVRICSVISIPSLVKAIVPEISSEADSIDDSEDTGYRVQLNELTMKLVIMTVYTQTITHHINSFTSHGLSHEGLVVWMLHVVPGRIMQIFLILATYIFILYKKAAD